MDLPARVQANAWTGDATAAGDLSPRFDAWTVRAKPIRAPKYLQPETPARPDDWRDSRIGWGLILPDRDGLSREELASGADAPEPIRRLLKARNGPVFRFRAGTEFGSAFLTNHATDQDVAISGSSPGIRASQLPRYLLIYGSPAEVPWELQYVL